MMTHLSAATITYGRRGYASGLQRHSLYDEFYSIENYRIPYPILLWIVSWMSITICYCDPVYTFVNFGNMLLWTKICKIET